MGHFRYLSFTLLVLICIGPAFLQPELLRWEIDDSGRDLEDLQSSLAESSLLKSLLESVVDSKRNAVSVNFKKTSQKLSRKMVKKALGLFRHGRPSLFFKSGFTSSAESYGGRGGMGNSRFAYDRPRPLRWG